MAANGKKTLYVSDMDGTLLSSDSRVSAESARIISELSAEGALITVATARTPATVVPLLADTHIAAEAIVMTGAARWDFRRGCFAHTHRIAAESTRRIIEICASRGAHPFVYIEAPDGRTMDVYHAAAAMNRAEESFYLERRHLKLKRFHLCKPVPADALERTLLMFAMGPRENIEEIAELIRMSSDCNVSCYPDIFNENIGNLEIQAPGISKASAIRSLGHPQPRRGARSGAHRRVRRQSQRPSHVRHRRRGRRRGQRRTRGQSRRYNHHRPQLHRRRSPLHRLRLSQCAMFLMRNVIGILFRLVGVVEEVVVGEAGKVDFARHLVKALLQLVDVGAFAGGNEHAIVVQLTHP